MKKTGDSKVEINNWECEKSGMWKLETIHEGTQVVNKMKLIKFCESRGITEIPIDELEKLFIAEYVASEKPQAETVVVPEGYEIVSIDGVEGFYKIPQFQAKKETPKAEPKASTKRGIENIIFDNESEGVDKFNGIEVDPLALVGIEDAQGNPEKIVEYIIEEAEIEKLGDISGFQDFEPDTDFPLHVDRHGVENKDKVRLYYGAEFYNELQGGDTTRTKIIKRAEAVISQYPDDDNRDLQQLLTRLENFPDYELSYCEGGESGRPFHSVGDGQESCDNCRFSNSYGNYGCTRNNLMMAR
jgi:hypothetical protein